MSQHKSYNFLIDKAKEFVENREFEKAIDYYQEAFMLEIQMQDLYEYGYLYMDLEKYALAREVFLSLIDIYPNEKGAYYALGLIYEELRIQNEAIDMYLAALKIEPRYVQCIFNLANIYLDQEDFKEAKSRFHQILTIEPDHYWTNLNLGSLYEQEGNFELAKRHTLKAQEIDDTQAMLHYNLGVIYTKEGNITKAIEEYTKELTKTNPYELTFRNLALLFKETKQFQKAKLILLEGIKSLKDDLSLWYNLGCIYALEDKFQDAYEAFVIAASLNYKILNDIKKDKELESFLESNEYVQLIRFFKQK